MLVSLWKNCPYIKREIGLFKGIEMSAKSHYLSFVKRPSSKENFSTRRSSLYSTSSSFSFNALNASCSILAPMIVPDVPNEAFAKVSSIPNGLSTMGPFTPLPTEAPGAGMSKNEGTGDSGSGAGGDGKEGGTACCRVKARKISPPMSGYFY